MPVLPTCRGLGLQLASVAALLLLLGCGGGSSPTPAEVVATPTTVDLGLVSATAPTETLWRIDNTQGGQQFTVDFVQGTNGFDVAPGQLPATVFPGTFRDVRIRFTPTSEGIFEGSVMLSFATATAVSTQTRLFRAEAVAQDLVLLTPDVAFGEVLPGTTSTRTVQVRNNGAVSALTVSAVTGPMNAFSLVGAPVSVAPGATVQLQVQYAPVDVADISGNLSIQSDGGTLTPTVTATSGGQEIIDFGTLSFTGGVAPEVTFTVPGDAIAFTIEAYVNGNTAVFLNRLEAPNGLEFENTSGTGPYLQRPDFGTFTVPVPNTDIASLQVQAGVWAVQVARAQGNDQDVQLRVVIERRPGNTGHVATLPLNIWLAPVLSVNAANAANDTDLQAIISGIDNILSAQGIRLGDIDYYDIGDSTYDDVTNGEFPQMLALSSGANEHRLNLFFVRTALGGGVLGVSAALGGPSLNGTGSSGVMSLYIENPSANQRNLVALVAAHEIGHFVGLAHTVEESGSHDQILDTLECPATGTNGTCSTQGGGYLMHWQAVGGTAITDGQATVIRGHALMEAALPALNALHQKPATPPQALVLPAQFAGSINWCGTCAQSAQKLHPAGTK